MGSNIPRKTLKSIFELTSSNEPWFGLCQIFQNPPVLTFFRSQPFLSKKKQMRIRGYRQTIFVTVNVIGPLGGEGVQLKSVKF